LAAEGVYLTPMREQTSTSIVLEQEIRSKIDHSDEQQEHKDGFRP